jgi:hypothetical protein
MFLGSFIEPFLVRFFQNDEEVFFLLLLPIAYAAALICAVFTVIINLKKQRNSEDILRTNMIIKLIHVPAYILIFLLGLAFLITIFTMGVSIVFVLLDCFTIFLSGLIGLSGVIRSYQEKKLTKMEAMAYGFHQFIFCIDVISAIRVYRYIRRKSEEMKTVELTENI